MTGPAPSAFPLPIAVSSAGDLFDASEADPGMELRDYFAGQALASMEPPKIYVGVDQTKLAFDAHAQKAYLIADTMMKEREKK